MRLFIDEDLTPRLTTTCHKHGYEATCVRDRSRLQVEDHIHAEFAFKEDWVLVTNDAGDFLKLAKQRGLHAGLIFILEGTIEQEQGWLTTALDHIDARSTEEGVPPAALMTNRVVDVDAEGGCEDYEWPA